MKVSADLIRKHAKAFYGIELTKERAAELANEVERLNGNVAKMAEKYFDFDDDPGALQAVLSGLKG